MPIAVTITGTDTTQAAEIVYGTLTLTGSYPANGDTLSFANQDQIKSGSLPSVVNIFEATPAPGPQSGYAFRYVPGTTQGNGLMEAFNGITQFAAGAYGTPPFAITGFVLNFQAFFPTFV